MKISGIILLLIYFSGFCCFAKKADRKKTVRPHPRVAKISPEWQVVVSPAKKSVKSAVGYVEVFPYGNNFDPGKFAVTTSKGKRVNAKMLWSAPGEPMKILFDNTSKAKSYSVLFGEKIPARKNNWEPKAGLILETRKRASGNANNWKEAKKVIDASKTIEGRSPVTKIFLGINPYGLSKDLVVRYKGYLKIKKSGDYKFAVAADDAVFLFIDGNKVTDWAGWHGPWAGVRGKFSGNIILKKGIHRIDYYNVQNQYGMRLVCGWKPPWRKHLEVIPPDAFVPLKKFKVDRIIHKGKVVSVSFKWESQSHLMVCDKAIVNMVFKAEKIPQGVDCRWFFDDSGRSSGFQTSHIFLSPGLRKVRMEAFKKGKKIGEIENLVKVAPHWTQREEWPKNVENAFMKTLKKLDYSKIPAADLNNWSEILAIIGKRDVLAELGKVCLKRKKDFADYPQLFFRLSECYIHYSIRRYDLADQAYRAAIEFSGGDTKLKAKAKLYLGSLEIDNYGKCDEGIKLLNEIDLNQLDSVEKRKRLMWLADGYMTKGDMDTVNQIYGELPDVVDKNKKRNTILNEARVLDALDYLRRGAYDDAEKMVRQVEWEFPREAMKSDTGLVMTKVFIKRKEYNYALWRCMRMMNASRNSRRMSDIMLTLIDIYDLLGMKKEAVELSGKLLEEFPYSEAAAILKSRQ